MCTQMGKNLFEKITDSDGDEVCSPSLHHHEAGWVGVMGLYTPPHPHPISVYAIPGAVWTGCGAGLW